MSKLANTLLVAWDWCVTNWAKIVGFLWLMFLAINSQTGWVSADTISMVVSAALIFGLHLAVNLSEATKQATADATVAASHADFAHNRLDDLIRQRSI